MTILLHGAAVASGMAGLITVMIAPGIIARMRHQPPRGGE